MEENNEEWMTEMRRKFAVEQAVLVNKSGPTDVLTLAKKIENYLKTGNENG